MWAEAYPSALALRRSPSSSETTGCWRQGEVDLEVGGLDILFCLDMLSIWFKYALHDLKCLSLRESIIRS